MKNQTHTNSLIGVGLALALGATLLPPVQAISAETSHTKAMNHTKGMEHCQEMKEMKQKYADDVKAQNLDLTERAAKMNTAPEDKKIALMASLVTQMVNQGIAMDARKVKMEEEMMSHMMKHMQMGKESMAQCSMMKEMDEKSKSPKNY